MEGVPVPLLQHELLMPLLPKPVLLHVSNACTSFPFSSTKNSLLILLNACHSVSISCCWILLSTNNHVHATTQEMEGAAGFEIAMRDTEKRAPRHEPKPPTVQSSRHVEVAKWQAGDSRVTYSTVRREVAA